MVRTVGAGSLGTVRAPLFIALALGPAVVVGAACRRGDPAGVGEVRAVRPIDERLLAVLGVAQALHRQADLLVAQGDRDGARSKVAQVLAIEFPADTPEFEAVRLDAAGRLAELYLEDGDTTAAEDAIAAALRDAGRPSYFRARLYHVRGRIHQRRSDEARGRGDAATADAEARVAMDWLERAIAEDRIVLGMTRAEAP
jgi:tetratricopeptide (TPR) repeat protein